MVAMRKRAVLKGLLTFIPGVIDLLPSRNTGHTDSAKYCYGVWMKHITLLRAHGLHAVPDTVAELGPGESIGVGLSALLSGSNHYYGLDVVAHSNIEGNLAMLEQLLPLFRERAGRPQKGWPDFDSWLDDRLFPSHILSEQVLQEALADSRIGSIREAIRNRSQFGAVTAEYKAPWADADVLIKDSVDLIISHSVLEHVIELERTYRALYQWLKPGGWMSHQIDLRSHGLTSQWNGFRACSDLVWKMAMGRRVYMINREPVSVHLRLMEQAGFRPVIQLKFFRDDGIRRDELASRWSDIPDEDLRCSGVYVIARK